MTTRSILLNAARDVDEDVAWKLVTQHARGVITSAEMDYKLAELVFDNTFDAASIEGYVQEALTAAFDGYTKELRKTPPEAGFLRLHTGPESEAEAPNIWTIPLVPEFHIDDAWAICKQEAKGHPDGQLIEASRLFWLKAEEHASATSSWAIQVLKEMNHLKSHITSIRKALERTYAAARVSD